MVALDIYTLCVHTYAYGAVTMHLVKDSPSLCLLSSENAGRDFDKLAAAAAFILWRLEKMRKAGKEDSGGGVDYVRSLRDYVLRLQSGKKRMSEEDRAVLLKLSSMPPSPGIIPVFSTVIKASIAGAITGGFWGMCFGVVALGIDGFPGGAYWGAIVAALLFGLVGAVETIFEPEKLRLARYLKYEVYEKHRAAILG